MKTIIEYFRLILFVCGVLIGVQFPAFIDQYGQRLEAHLLESQLSLQAFQRDADKFFAGDIHRLISHYQRSADEVVQAGGNNIQTIYDRAEQLQAALQQFKQSELSSIQHVLITPVDNIRTETWQGFTHMVVLDTYAILMGLVLGLFIALLTESCLVCVGRGCRYCFHLGKKPHKPA
ncbi:DUF2937 family protein [Shewanella gaetbuli]